MGKLVFLTGCGRSGTTILGQLIERHPDVVYLNDQFTLWIDALPVADIWAMSHADANHRAKIELTAGDVDQPGVHDAIQTIRARLHSARNGAPVLIEKLAINNFRLGFLHAAFPDALFINIKRHGIEVATSIAKKIEQGQWYGEDDRKWEYLCEHAEAVGLGSLARTCETPMQRGLLEWRMSVESASRFFELNRGLDTLHVTYDQLLAEPREMAARLSALLGLPPNEAKGDWALANISRRSPPATAAGAKQCTDAERIAGDTLRRFGFSFQRPSESRTSTEGAAH